MLDSLQDRIISGVYADSWLHNLITIPIARPVAQITRSDLELVANAFANVASKCAERNFEVRLLNLYYEGAMDRGIYVGGELTHTVSAHRSYGFPSGRYARIEIRTVPFASLDLHELSPELRELRTAPIIKFFERISKTHAIAEV